MALNERDMFSSSPAHPSHHGSRHQRTATQRVNLKRSASAAALPSPPRSTVKKRVPYSRPTNSQLETVFDTEEDEADDSQDRSPCPSPTPRGVATHSKLSALMAGQSASGRSLTPDLFAIQTTANRSPSPIIETKAVDNSRLLGFEAEEQDLGAMTPDEASDTEPDSGPKAPPRALLTPPPTREHRARPVVKHSGPIRDTPNNPFLSTSPRKRRPVFDVHLEDRPTIGYVFRGVRTEFANPYTRRQLAPGQVDPSTLDPSHPDFSPDPNIVPKLLWPSRDESPSPEPEPLPRSRATRATSRSNDVKGKGRAQPLPPVSVRGKKKVVPPRTASLPPSEKPLARRLFATEIAAASASSSTVTAATVASAKKIASRNSTPAVASTSKTRASAVAGGLKPTASTVVTRAHGPIRGPKNARPVGISREPSYNPKLARIGGKEKNHPFPVSVPPRTRTSTRNTSSSSSSQPPVWRG